MVTFERLAEIGGFRLRMTDRYEREVGFLRYGKLLARGATLGRTGAILTGRLAGDESQTYVLNLSQVFDMTSGGTHTLHVVWEGSDDEQEIRCELEPLVLQVRRSVYEGDEMPGGHSLLKNSQLLYSIRKPSHDEPRSGVDRASSRRHHIISNLIGIVRNDANSDENVNSPYQPKELAMELLGEYRAVEAIPVLLEHLAYLPDHRRPKEGETPPVDTPAVEALIEIGRPATAAAVAEIGVSDGEDYRRLDLLLAVVRGVEGVRGGSFALHEAHAASRDDDQLARYQAAVVRYEQLYVRELER